MHRKKIVRFQLYRFLHDLFIYFPVYPAGPFVTWVYYLASMSFVLLFGHEIIKLYSRYLCYWYYQVKSSPS